MKVILALGHYRASRLAINHGLAPDQWVNGTAPGALNGHAFKHADVIVEESFWQRPDAREVWAAVMSRMETEG